MEATRPDVKVHRPRCPFCHEDIVPGEDNYACHECLVWHHSECWNDHGSCVACGNEWLKDPTSGLMSSSGPPAKNTAFLDLVSTVNRLVDKDHADIRRAESGPKEEPPCKHKFDDELVCVHCRQDAEELYGEDYADTLLSKREQEAIDNEMIVCLSGDCEEPARRIEQFCSLCQAEIEIFGEPKARKDLTDKDRKQAIASVLRARELSASIGCVVGGLIVVAVAALMVYEVVFRA